VDALVRAARLCSQNEHKRAELAQVLSGWRVELLETDGYPPEVGETFLDNARGKAGYGRRVGPTDEWVLGEDSGIELTALGGLPGVQTARWADGRHVERALDALAGLTDRSARYVCELVAVSPDGRATRGTGTLEGTIALEPRGSEGFGFDPVFVPLGEEQTVAELGDAWKSEYSHRARAAKALLAALASCEGVRD
jgi:XTP/dITP diphosphohydrolase